MIDKTVFLYSDGACVPNPGRGSWAFVLVDRNDHRGKILMKGSKAVKETTNIRMEYLAFIEGIRAATIQDYKIEAFSDLNLLVNAFKSVEKYERENYKNKKNVDLLKQIFELKTANPGRINLTWVRGHSGVHWNEFCDRECAKSLGFRGGDELTDTIKRIAYSRTLPNSFRQKPALTPDVESWLEARRATERVNAIEKDVTPFKKKLNWGESKVTSMEFDDE